MGMSAWASFQRVRKGLIRLTRGGLVAYHHRIGFGEESSAQKRSLHHMQVIGLHVVVRRQQQLREQSWLFCLTQSEIRPQAGTVND
jgi:hypothetical protein